MKYLTIGFTGTLAVLIGYSLRYLHTNWTWLEEVYRLNHDALGENHGFPKF